MNPLGYTLREQAKALVGGLLAGLGYLQSSLSGGITPEEWLGTAIAALLAYSVVFGVPNNSAN